MQARRTLRGTTGSSVGWSAIVVVFSATARSMPARLMSMSMPVAGDGVAGGRSGVVVRPAGTGGRAPTAVYGSTWVQCPAALVAREVLAGAADVTAEHGAIKVVGFQHLDEREVERDARSSVVSPIGRHGHHALAFLPPVSLEEMGGPGPLTNNDADNSPRATKTPVGSANAAPIPCFSRRRRRPPPSSLDTT